MDSPFTPDALRELRHAKGWRLDQIAVLASANVGEPVDVETVRSWFAAAGIRTEAPTASETTAHLQAAGVLPAPAPSNQPARRKPIQPKFTKVLEIRHCNQCGATIRRYPSQFRGVTTFCNFACATAYRLDPAHKAARVLAQEEAAKAKRVTETRPCASCGKPITRVPSGFTADIAVCDHKCLAAWTIAKRTTAPSPTAKQCDTCRETKAIAEFSVDRNRGDGYARTCLACSRARSKRYYEANRERQIARSLAYKQEKRSRNANPV